MTDDRMLLIDSCINGGFEIDLNESNLEKGLLRFRGKFQEAEAINKNKRMYPFGVLDENVQRLMEVVKGRGLLGELDHPTDSIIHFKDASHVITKLYWTDNVLMGEGEVLSTAHGRQLKALLNDGVRVGISSRGVGNGKVNENGVLVIGESYKLITFDAVADPSTFAAFQEKVIGAKRENVMPQNYYDSSAEPKKVDKNVLLACLGAIIKDKGQRMNESL